MTDLFGHMPDGTPVPAATLDNGTLRVDVIAYGATLRRIEAPDRTGRRINVALGLDTLEQYLAHGQHFGAIAGRYTGRIAHGRFTLDGHEHRIPPNHGIHALHGGKTGFGTRVWHMASVAADHVDLTLHSPDGDEGFPGALDVRVRYSLDGADLRIDVHAVTDAPTVVNLTNHSYFNLAGEGSGDILGHRLQIPADIFLPANADSIPTGELRPVTGTAFDFRTPRPIGARIRDADPQLLHTLGYDHAFLLPGTGLRRAGWLHDPVSGRTLDVLTTEPAVHLYTGNNLRGSLAGPSRQIYRQSDGICLETERPQDSPNQPGFPSTVLRPGVPFVSTTVFRFGVD